MISKGADKMYAQPLGKALSLVLNGQPSISAVKRTVSPRKLGKKHSSISTEFVSDSEEERIKERAREVIEISSDEDACSSDASMPGAWPDDSKQRISPRQSRPTDKFSCTQKIIDLDDSSPERNSTKVIPKTSKRFVAKHPTPTPRDPDEYIVDDSVIILDEIGTKKLVPRDVSIPGTPVPHTPRKKVAGPPTPGSSTSRRPSKKVLEKERWGRLEEFAARWFKDINQNVFNNQLPADTELVWNARLISTAGRASFRIDRTGCETSAIELSRKILDREERIRLTLSHEMCHLASWYIDRKMSEQHGKYFQKWANRVTQICPDVCISVKHNYEIEYPYTWQCTCCRRIIGRFSKSVNTDKQGCPTPTCNAARLEALFQTRKRKANGSTPQCSKMGATTPRAPLAIIPNCDPNTDVVLLDTSDPDSDIEIISKALTSISIIN